MLQDVSGSTVMRDMLDRGYRVAAPRQVFLFADHLPTTMPGVQPRAGWSPIAVPVLAQFEQLARSLGVNYIGGDHPDHGIAHVAAPELGLVLPGLAVACGDSHTCTLGALGALAWGIGTSEATHILATQTSLQRRPRDLRVSFDGALAPGVTAKDMALALIAHIGAGAGAGFAVEFAGEAVRSLPVEARMTLCNMAVEFSAQFAVIAPDGRTFEFLHGRRHAPEGAAWDDAVAAWRALRSDDDARFDSEVTIDASKIAPQVTWGISPEHACAIGDAVPDPADCSTPDERAFADRALRYQRLQPGTRMADVPIDVAYIGTCTNARLSDLREAARLLRGRKVAPSVTAICVPGSMAVRREAEAEGLDRIFREAGFEWHQPGCGMCGSGRGRLEDVRVIGTTNRNFENRQGRATRTHLASPATVAASAITGRITDPRSV
jgi:3-isopropylmalate/(R)-2-methylmalate dehydratase large subunit